MTGSAKQSIAPQAEAWIASSLSLLAMTAQKSDQKQKRRARARRFDLGGYLCS
jgi:hypothetical protein